MLDVYATFAEEQMAMPVLKGLKTDAEKFAGAQHTYCIEALMQDNRALQAGTSHNLGQNFANAFDVKFQTESGEWEHVWSTSWGVSTRLVGGLVMTHSDDNGLVLPPRLAPVQVVVVPIFKGKDTGGEIVEAASKVADGLRARGIRVKLDDRENLSPGFKFHEWELAGVPLRVELGPKDLEKGTVVAVKRMNRSKSFIPMNELDVRIPALLDEIQGELFEAARARRDAATFTVDTYDELKQRIEKPDGFLLCHWCGDGKCEEQVKDETKATIRCLSLDQPEESGRCIRCDGESKRRVHFAKAY